ncbi:helix-turn-helix domain-containing protein [Paenibacillus sp. HJGM_3]|uniref:helix-turn-helix domain-containing protein n=1 Tax=Paenibacillus sp. HJGM_3 TaxID=3379816 RepID=UPI00385F9B89
MKEYAHEYAEFKYRMPGDLERAGGLWPLRIGCNIAKPSYWVGPRAIECYSIHWVRSGSLLLDSPEGRYRLEAGDWFCKFPQVVYQYGIAGTEEELAGRSAGPLKLGWLAFDGPQAAAMLQGAGVTPEQPVKRAYRALGCGHAEEDPPEWKALYTAFDEEDRGLPSALRLQSSLYAWFSRLTAVSTPSSLGSTTATSPGPMYAMSEPSPASDGAASPIERKLLDAEAYMKLHYREGITVQEAALHVKLNRSYFTQRFAERFGLPPREYLQRLRMEEARALLGTSDRSITEIALTVGYPDLYGFTRAFVREHAMSPTAYRRMHRGVASDRG